jgi:GNAT superfamily N-acetyltransferase
MHPTSSPPAAGTATPTRTRDLQVRVLDTTDEARLRRWHQLTELADTYRRPWATQWSFEEMRVRVRPDDGSERWVLTGAFDGEEMVGAGLMVFPLLDNTDMVYAGVYVEPELRRRGIGSTVMEHLMAWTRAEGRSVLLVDSGLPGDEREDHPYARFARKHGFTMANVEVHRVLDLPLERSVLEAMRAEAAAHHPGYRILTFEDGVPADLVPSYLKLTNQLALDAPTGEIEFEAERATPEVYRRQMERMAEQGRHRLTTLAVSGDGEAVAYTDLVVPPTDRPKVYQWGTLVRRDHRGHHLGAAVKVGNLLALQERYPERTEIHTTNSEVNDTMIKINDRFGFRVVEICPEFQLKL